MIVVCPECGAQHAVPASRLPAPGGVLVCRRCAAEFRPELPPPEAENPSAAADVSAPDPEAEGIPGLRLEVSSSDRPEPEEDELLPAPIDLAPGASPDDAPLPALKTPAPVSEDEPEEETRIAPPVVDERTSAALAAEFEPSMRAVDDTTTERAAEVADFEQPETGIDAALADSPAEELVDAPNGYVADPASLEPTLAGEPVPPIERVVPVDVDAEADPVLSPPPAPTVLPEVRRTSDAEIPIRPEHAVEAPEATAERAPLRGASTGDLGRISTLRAQVAPSVDEEAGLVRAPSLDLSAPPPLASTPSPTFRPPPATPTFKPPPATSTGSDSPLAAPVSLPPMSGGIPRAPAGLAGPLDPDLPPAPRSRVSKPRTASGSPWTMLATLAATGVVGGLIGAMVLRALSAPEPIPPLPEMRVEEVRPEPVLDTPPEVQPESERPEETEPESPAFADPAAAPGYAFLARDIGLAPTVRGRAGKRVSAGTEVRRLSATDGWVLVLVEPGGPAGFVEADALESRIPVRALARKMAFRGCRSRVPRCVAKARDQQDACVARCGVAERNLRCEAACRMAFERCRRDCRTR